MARGRRRIGERLLRRLIRAVSPRVFDREWGDEIVRTSLERGADARAEGWVRLASFWAREAFALGAVAVKARRSAAQRRRDPMLFEAEDTRPLRVAWVVAIAFHFLAFLVVFPFEGDRLEASPESPVMVIQEYEPPRPPEPEPEAKRVTKRTSPVPIPDPTPDEPEPIVAETDFAYVEPEERADVDFVVPEPSGPPPAAHQELYRAGADVRPPVRTEYVEPAYPELARRARLECTAVLEARIGRTGDVLDVRVLRGCGLGLDAAAREAVSQWKYEPTMVNGRPVEVLMTVTVIFRLQ